MKDREYADHICPTLCPSFFIHNLWYIILMQLLSNGQPSTLRNWLELAKIANRRGFMTDNAIMFLMERIEKEGPDAEVIQPEEQVIALLMSM